MAAAATRIRGGADDWLDEETGTRLAGGEPEEQRPAAGPGFPGEEPPNGWWYWWPCEGAGEPSMQGVWASEERAEPMLGWFAGRVDAGRGTYDDRAPVVVATSRACLVLLREVLSVVEACSHALPDLGRDLTAMSDVAAVQWDRAWVSMSPAEFAQRAAAAGRAADRIAEAVREARADGEPIPAFAPGDVVRAHIPWESIPNRQWWEMPAPFGRYLDGDPFVAEPGEFSTYADAVLELQVDPERLRALAKAILDAVAQEVPDNPHAQARLRAAHEVPEDPYDWQAPLWRSVCALVQATCPCCDSSDRAEQEASARFNAIAIPIVRRMLPEAAELVDRYTAEVNR